MMRKHSHIAGLQGRRLAEQHQLAVVVVLMLSTAMQRLLLPPATSLRHPKNSSCFSRCCT